MVLGKDDVVVYNAGVHNKPDRTLLYQTLDDLGRLLFSLRSNNSLPRWVYLNTITQHFETGDGLFTKGHNSTRCQPSVARNPRLESQLEVLREGVNVQRRKRVCGRLGRGGTARGSMERG